MRTDPTDTGGLFVSRRPGTRPVRYRGVPERRQGPRRAIDATVAAAILVFMGLVAVCFWGPIPMAWLWIGAQIKYHTDSVSLGIFVAFLGMILTLLAGLALMRRLDQFWILVRRANGHDQRHGVIGPVFAVAAVIGVTLFTIWLVLIAGLSPSLAPTK
jgi:divalent metal cation (Fe/Co/Zn/Cd) transporter